MAFRRRSASVALTTLVLTGAVLGGCTAESEEAASGPATTAADAASPTPTTGAPTTGGTSATTTPSTPPTSAAAEHADADVSFASMMVPHHEQAVEMADIVVAKEGLDPQVAQLARQIRDAQAPEIQAMTSWLQGWGADAGHGDHSGHMAGMLDEKQMAALREADGPAAGRLFLDGMIEHHEGALDMARAELEKGTNPQARQLAQQIITSQEAEIAQMRSMLGG